MNNKKLFFLLMILLGMYGASQFFGNKGDRSFKTEIISIDTTQVTSITLQPKSENFEEVILKKEAGTWFVTKGNITDEATTGSVNSLLNNLVLVKTKQVATKNKEKWSDYEVEEGKGNRIKIYSGSKLLEDFIVGRFDFNQQTRSATSFIRLANGNEVYTIDGFMSMSFSQGFDAYRDKTLLKFNAKDITNFTYTLPGNTIINIQKNNGQWMYETSLLDSTKVADYLSSIAQISGAEFADDFDETQSSGQKYKSIELKGNNITEAIILSCYQIEDEEKPFILKSNINPTVAFKSDATGIYEKIFKELSSFLPN